MLKTFPVKLTFNESKKKWTKVPALERGVNWQTWEGGHDDAENYGVIVPQGHLIVDLDPKGDQSLGELQAACEVRWGIEVDWDGAFLQETPSGGAHYGFEITWVARQSQDDDAPYDTRCAGIGWICTGKNYKQNDDGILNVFDGFSLPNLPPIDELMFKPTVEVDDFTAHIKSDVTIEQIQEQLDKLDAKDPEAVKREDSWSKVGRIISFELGAEGKDVFKEWSKQCGDDYDENEIERKWDSWKIGRGAPLRFGSLVYMAKKPTAELLAELSSCEVNDVFKIAGELDELNQIETLKRNQIIKSRLKDEIGKAPTDAQINRAIILETDDRNDDWLTNYVATSTGDFIDKTNAARYNKSGFDLKHGDDVPLNADGKAQTPSYYACGRIDVINVEIYEPCVDELLFDMDGLKCFNTYRDGGCGTDGTGEGFAMFKAQLKHLLHAKDAELLLFWLAHNVQFPGKIIGWAPVLKGCQGDGKSFFGVMMQHIFGLRNIRQLDPRQLTTDFSGWAEGQLITFIEEIKVNNKRFDVLNSFKPYVTNQTVDVTSKGRDPKSVPNRTNYLFFTNFEDALPIKEGDRRYAVFKTKWQQRPALVEWENNEGKGYYKKLFKVLHQDPESIKSGLLDVSIPEWFLDSAVAPKTEGTNEMIEASKSTAQKDIEYLIDTEEIGGDVIRLDVLKHLADESDIELPKLRALNHLMSDLGYPHNKRLKIAGVMITVYSKVKKSVAALREYLSTQGTQSTQ